MEHRLDWKGGHLWKGDTDLGKCETDAARRLLELALANERDTFLTFRGDMPCFRAKVKWAAGKEVTTSGTGTPTFVKYKESVERVRTGKGRGGRAKTPNRRTTALDAPQAQ